MIIAAIELSLLFIVLCLYVACIMGVILLVNACIPFFAMVIMYSLKVLINRIAKVTGTLVFSISVIYILFSYAAMIIACVFEDKNERVNEIFDRVMKALDFVSCGRLDSTGEKMNQYFSSFHPSTWQIILLFVSFGLVLSVIAIGLGLYVNIQWIVVAIIIDIILYFVKGKNEGVSLEKGAAVERFKSLKKNPVFKIIRKIVALPARFID